MNYKKIIKIICAYVCFAWVVVTVIKYNGHCTYERNISESDIEQYCVSGNGYIYGIENITIDRNDVHKIGTISGWFAVDGGEYYYPAASAIVLSSESNSYQVKIYGESRPDLLFLNQTSEINTEVGFVARFSSDTMQDGKYRIGFVSKENGKKIVSWTDEYVII